MFDPTAIAELRRAIVESLVERLLEEEAGRVHEAPSPDVRKKQRPPKPPRPQRGVAA